jgi:hypothetical protein
MYYVGHNYSALKKILINVRIQMRKEQSFATQIEKAVLALEHSVVLTRQRMMGAFAMDSLCTETIVK